MLGWAARVLVRLQIFSMYKMLWNKIQTKKKNQTKIHQH